MINKLLECVSGALSQLPLWWFACQSAVTLPLHVASLGVSSRQIRTCWHVLVSELCLQCPSVMATSVSGGWCMLLQMGMTFHTCVVAAGACHSFTEVRQPAMHPEGKEFQIQVHFEVINLSLAAL